jgi:hypothetical protein
MRIVFTTVLGVALAASALAQPKTESKSDNGDKNESSETTLSTPFGKAKIDRSKLSKPAPKPTKIRPDLVVEMAGDSFKFSKKTPFGTNAWTRTEAELSTQERAIVEQRGLLKVEEEPGDEEVQAAAK